MPIVSELREVIGALQSEAEFEAAVSGPGGRLRPRSRPLSGRSPGAVLAATCGAAAPALLAAGSGVSVGGLAALFGQRHEAHVHEWMTESQILNGGIVLIGA
jgi:hypothetical protein